MFCAENSHHDILSYESKNCCYEACHPIGHTNPVEIVESFVTQSIRCGDSPFVQNHIYYLGLFCWMMVSSKLIYEVKAFLPEAVNEQVVRDRLF